MGILPSPVAFVMLLHLVLLLLLHPILCWGYSFWDAACWSFFCSPWFWSILFCHWGPSWSPCQLACTFRMPWRIQIPCFPSFSPLFNSRHCLLMIRVLASFFPPWALFLWSRKGWDISDDEQPIWIHWIFFVNQLVVLIIDVTMNCLSHWLLLLWLLLTVVDNCDFVQTNCRYLHIAFYSLVHGEFWFEGQIFVIVVYPLSSQSLFVIIKKRRMLAQAFLSAYSKFWWNKHSLTILYFGYPKWRTCNIYISHDIIGWFLCLRAQSLRIMLLFLTLF